MVERETLTWFLSQVTIGSQNELRATGEYEYALICPLGSGLISAMRMGTRVSVLSAFRDSSNFVTDMDMTARFQIVQFSAPRNRSPQKKCVHRGSAFFSGSLPQSAKAPIKWWGDTNGPLGSEASRS
jgi:hypothetical protein